MKKFTLHVFALAVALFTTSGIFAQETTYTDDFSVANDYLTTAKAGIWEGVLLNSGLRPTETVAEITALNTTDSIGGMLSFSTINSAWDGGNDRGAALYRTIKGGADFEMQVKIVGGDYLSLGSAARKDYLMSGLIAKVKDDTTYVLIQAFDVTEWSAVIGLRDIPAAEGLLEENWKFEGLTLADFPYQKLEKYGTAFTGYYSADGMVWEEIYSVEKPQFTGKDIQVGLYSCTYTENEGHVYFDDFSLTDYSAPILNAVKEIKVAQPINALYNNQKIIVTNGSKNTISSIKLYTTNGAVVYNNKNINSSTFSIPVAKSGMYILVSQSAGKTYSQKIAVY